MPHEQLPDANVRQWQTALLMRVLAWYFRAVYGLREGPGRIPFYCDPACVGSFAIAPDEIAAGSEPALFRLFITLSMFQALRDVVIMRQQRSLSRASMRIVADAGTLCRAVKRQKCLTLEEGCDVTKRLEHVDCGRHPGRACHVKNATKVFNRMGDMGKLPTSAWLRLWKPGGVRTLLERVRQKVESPAERAVILVEYFAGVYRVGRKLATMFVSTLSTPALAPGLTPWFPEVDGNSLVVVDTNVARAVDALRGPDLPRTYGARVRWLREHAVNLDLREFRSDLPS